MKKIIAFLLILILLISLVPAWAAGEEIELYDYYATETLPQIYIETEGGIALNDASLINTEKKTGTRGELNTYNDTNATVSVTVERADAAATLVLKAGGATVATWTGVAAGQTAAASFRVGLGDTKRYVFSLVHDDVAAGERYEAAVTNGVLGRPAVGWLDVRFDRAAYDAWPFASSAGRDPADGGTWTKSAGTNETAFVSDGGNRRLKLKTSAADRVVYAASSASSPGLAVMVRGRAQLVSEPGAPETPEEPPLAGLALGDEGAGLALYGWTADGWVALAGAPVAENEWIDWNATVDFTASPVTVTYGIGGTVLSNATTGATALPVAGAPTSLRAVRYTGNGLVDDFRGVYYEPVAIVSIREPVFATTAGAPVSFRVEDNAPLLSLSVSVEGQPSIAQYVAFTCPTLSNDDREWTAAADSRPATAAETAAGALRLDVPASADTLFVKLVVSDQDIAKGTKLSELQ